MMAQKLDQKAELTGSGGVFDDWESVWVQRTWGDAFHQFRFRCAERSSRGVQEKFKPNDLIQVKLAGELAINGLILVRQVGYESASHAVQIQGVSTTWPAARANIIKKFNYQGKTFLEIADELLKDTDPKVKHSEKGKIDSRPFDDHMELIPGESIWSALERLARQRNILMTCDPEGNFIFVGEKQKSSSIGKLIEGVNIKKMQFIASTSDQWSDFILYNQTRGSDDKKFRAASEQGAKAKGRSPFYSPKLTLNEHPVREPEEVMKRADTEALWTEGHEITAVVTVLGWTPEQGGKLWQEGDSVYIQSPMCPLDQEMSIQSVTFTQDDKSGTLSTLVCIAPWGLSADQGFNVATPSPPQPAQNIGAR